MAGAAGTETLTVGTESVPLSTVKPQSYQTAKSLPTFHGFATPGPVIRTASPSTQAAESSQTSSQVGPQPAAHTPAAPVLEAVTEKSLPKLRPNHWLRSIGDSLISRDKITYWELVGPAQSIWPRLKEELHECLKDPANPHRVKFTPFMRGTCQQNARPVVLLTHPKKEVCKQAKRLLIDADILNQDLYRQFTIEIASSIPKLHRPVPLMSTVIADSFTTFTTKELTVWRHKDTGSCVLVNLRPGAEAVASVSGLVVIGSELFCFTSAHALTGRSPFDDDTDSNGEHEEDWDADTLDSGLGSDAEDDDIDHINAPLEAAEKIRAPETVRAATSESNSDGVRPIFDQRDRVQGSSGTTDPTQTSTVRPADVSEPSPPLSRPGSSIAHTFIVDQVRHQEYSRLDWWLDENVQVLLGSESLDFALIKIPDDVISAGIRNTLSDLPHYQPRQEQEQEPPKAAKLKVRTSLHSVLSGRFMANSVSMVKAQSNSLDELWVYLPEESDNGMNKMQQGDSGSWVFDQAGDALCGHVVAGDLETGAAYVVPYQAVFNDIHNLFGPPRVLRYKVAKKIMDLLQQGINQRLNLIKTKQSSPGTLQGWPNTNSIEPTGRDLRNDMLDTFNELDNDEEASQDVIEPPPAYHATDSRQFEEDQPEATPSSSSRVLRLSLSVGEDLMPYQYKPLTRPDRLRILVVQPATSRHNPLSCSFLDLEDRDANYIDVLGDHVSYEALSYCWGESSDERRLLMADQGRYHSLPVLSQLYAALLALRRSDMQRYLWVDSICINQRDPAERNCHVARMSKIYGNASNLCIWLGDSDESSARAIPFVRRVQHSDVLYDDNRHVQDWMALTSLMKRSWFRRAWVVQELALAQHATIHCGTDCVEWTDLSSTISLLIEPSGLTSRLSQIARAEGTLELPDNFFGQLSDLPAARFVKIADRLFRRHKNRFPQANGKLEQVMEWLTHFETSDPRDVVYALLSLANDAQPSVSYQIPEFLHGKRLTGRQQLLLLRAAQAFSQKPRERYPVRYDLPVVDVYQQFISFALRHAPPTRALDIVCRPFAMEATTEQDSASESSTIGASCTLRLPSWIPSKSKSPFVKRYDLPQYTVGDPGNHHFSWKRERGDLFVSSATSGTHYSAAGHKEYNRRSVFFRKRSEHFSMFVQGFILDKVTKVADTAHGGHIPSSWLRIGREYANEDAFLTTLVADRGPRGPTPAYYRRILAEVLHQHREGSVDTQALLHGGSAPYVSEVMRHIVATISGRRLIETQGRKLLGLAPEDTEPGDLVCIVFGCTVPLILRPAHLKDIDKEQEFDHQTYLSRRDAAVAMVRRWRHRCKANRCASSLPRDDSAEYEKTLRLVRSLRNLHQSIEVLLSLTYARLPVAQLMAFVAAVIAVIEYQDSAVGFLWAVVVTLALLLAAGSLESRQIVCWLALCVWLVLSVAFEMYNGVFSNDARALRRVSMDACFLFLLLRSYVPTPLWRSAFNKVTEQIFESTLLRSSKDKAQHATPELSARNNFQDRRQPLPPEEDLEDARNLTHKYAFTLVGESYINGMMNGEAISLQNESLESEERIWTVDFELR